MDALQKVLRLPAVHSKRFLTSKVDRCVTGDALRVSCALAFEHRPYSYNAHGRGSAAESRLAIKQLLMCDVHTVSLRLPGLCCMHMHMHMLKCRCHHPWHIRQSSHHAAMWLCGFASLVAL